MSRNSLKQLMPTRLADAAFRTDCARWTSGLDRFSAETDVESFRIQIQVFNMQQPCRTAVPPATFSHVFNSAFPRATSSSKYRSRRFCLPLVYYLFVWKSRTSDIWFIYMLSAQKYYGYDHVLSHKLLVQIYCMI